MRREGEKGSVTFSQVGFSTLQGGGPNRQADGMGHTDGEGAETSKEEKVEGCDNAV